MTQKVTDAKEQQQASAQQVNIFAAKEIANFVRSTLGPMGMDKMLVDQDGSSMVTNDGATILRQMNITHPTAKMIIEVARTQEETCYDGTTSSIIITGELMKQAEALLSKKIHPTMIVKGFKLAANKAEDLLQNIALDSGKSLLTVAQTAMTGKSAESDKALLADICVDVAQSAKLSDISIIKRPGGKVSDSVAIAGLLVDKSKVHHSMPDVIEDAKITLIDIDITLPEFAKELQVQVHNNDAVEEFITKRKQQLQSLAQVIIDSGANVVLCLRDIDGLVVEYLAKHGIYAARRVAKSDMEAVHKATGARIVSAIDDLVNADLGTCGLLEEVQINDEPLIKLTKTPHNQAVSVLLRAPTKHTVDEVGRAFDDAIGVVSLASEGKVLAGGGSAYMYLSLQLKEFARTVGGRSQMAVEAFADALEIIPSTLAENSGLDPLDTLIALRQAHTADDKDSPYYGVNVYEGGVINMLQDGVIEPMKVISQGIQSATETAAMVLRIDNIITSKNISEIGEDGYQY
jgi:chaperonin GroEL (HSP60 family)